jgi:hypothetical protein
MTFPITCVDNFYSDPHKVRDFALSLDYHRFSGNYPGQRTRTLDAINEKFFNSFAKRLFSLYYNLDSESIEWNIHTSFQKIYTFDDDINSVLNNGWIHIDGNPTIAAGVIYLNPTPNPEAGTSFYSISNPYLKIPDNYKLRNELYSGKSVDLQEYSLVKEEYEGQFTKTVEIKNSFNRLAFYGAQYPHKESNFCADLKEPRLTQVFFINALRTSTGTPLIVKNNYEIEF